MTKLETFLRKKRVWTKFKKNTVKLRGQVYLDYILEDRGNDLDAIHTAFYWGDSPEGFEFWGALAQQYVPTLTIIK